MPPRTAARRSRRKAGKRRGIRPFLLGLWPNVQQRRRGWRAVQGASVVTKIIVGLVVVLVLSAAVNGIYQVIRKPSELFFPVSGALYKTPTETWRQYGPLFKKHATGVMTPDLLAAIAQVEGSGNPVVRTYWRWVWTTQFFEMYRPASSAVGMYQITDGTFAEARRYCIHRHVVVEDGPWISWQSCWFNSLYARVIPSHAVELTSAYLDRSVANILERHRMVAATLQHKQQLAAVIHLCGAGAGDAYARREFQLLGDQRCGDQVVRVYLARVNAMRRLFDGLASPRSGTAHQ